VNSGESNERYGIDKEDIMSISPDKEKAVETAMGQIERQFGKGSIMKLGSSPIIDVPTIPTGSLAFDKALGIGGLPRGRVIEIFGPEASGKTTLALHAVAEAQKQGGIVAFVDAEHALDTSYAKRLGVNCEELLVAQPDTGEQALEIADMLVRSGAIDIVVIDSVAALVPRAEIEGEMGDTHMGLQARLMSQALRKLTGTISKTMTLVIFINQIRMKIGVVFGNPETTTGGNALKFYSSVRIDIRRIGAIKDGQEIVGNRTRVRVVKNKMAPPFMEAEFDILYGEGISQFGDLLDTGVQTGVVEKSGSWFSYDGERIGQGRQNVIRFLKDNPDMYHSALVKVKESLGLSQKLEMTCAVNFLTILRNTITKSLGVHLLSLPMIPPCCLLMQVWCSLNALFSAKKKEGMSGRQHPKNVSGPVGSITIWRMLDIRQDITPFSKCLATFPSEIISRKRPLISAGIC
jgi:recombination protein RecA